MLNTVLLLTLSLLVASPPQGEESRKALPPEDPTGIVVALKVKDPSWVLKKQVPAGRGVTYSFVRDEQQLFVTAITGESEEDARSQLDEFAMRVTAVPVEVKGIGQRCLIWTSPSSGISTVVFRRGRKFFYLRGPSKEESIRVARHLDESLTP